MGFLKKAKRKPSVQPEEMIMTLKGLDQYMLPKPAELRRITEKKNSSEPSSPKQIEATKPRKETDYEDRITAPNMKMPNLPDREGPSVGESLRATLARKRWQNTKSKILAVGRLAHPLGGVKGAFGMPAKAPPALKILSMHPEEEEKENECKPPSPPRSPVDKKRRRRRRDSMQEEVNKPMVEKDPTFIMPGSTMQKNQNLTFPSWLIDA